MPAPAAIVSTPTISPMISKSTHSWWRERQRRRNQTNGRACRIRPELFQILSAPRALVFESVLADRRAEMRLRPNRRRRLSERSAHTRTSRAFRPSARCRRSARRTRTYRARRVGILTEEGYPVAAAGILDVPETEQAKRAFMTPPGEKCPSAGTKSMIRKDGCDFCTDCGYTGACG